jgi:hypothetical protein
MALAEISDKVSPESFVVLSLVLSLVTVAMGCMGRICTVVAGFLVALWDLMMILELSDRSFIQIARLEFGNTYEGSVIAAGLIPTVAIVGIGIQALWRKPKEDVCSEAR